jgi:phosphopantothenoylcysteine decarboxylase/phosphopantothenate--cysteine ligase
VTGSIGALWAAQFVLELRTGHHVRDVRVVVSESARQMVTPAALRAVSGSPVLGGLFDADAPFSIGHVQLAADADVLIVMPATANIIGKTANGIADDAVSASIMAAACPVVFVPNMNDVMWQRPAVQRNIRTLVRDGYHVVPPVEGVVVSTGRSAVGGMPDFDTILAAVRRVLTRAARNQRGTRATTSGQSRDRAQATKPARRRRRRSS